MNLKEDGKNGKLKIDKYYGGLLALVYGNE